MKHLPLLSAALLLVACHAAALHGDEPAATDTLPAESQPADTQPAAERAPVNLPHITINLEEKYIDVQAKVVARDPDWLELLVCAPKSREHESILTTEARPSHIHLALIMLGLEPGKPLRGELTDGVIKITPATGPRVMISVIYTQDDQPVEVPANQWVINRNTGESLPDDTWLFTGSAIVEFNDQRIYMADVNGTVISVVNFEDDLLAYDTELTNHNDDGTWKAATDKIPAIDTPVTLRLRPAPAKPDKASDDAEQADSESNDAPDTAPAAP